MPIHQQIEWWQSQFQRIGKFHRQLLCKHYLDPHFIILYSFPKGVVVNQRAERGRTSTRDKGPMPVMQPGRDPEPLAMGLAVMGDPSSDYFGIQ